MKYYKWIFLCLFLLLMVGCGKIEEEHGMVATTAATSAPEPTEAVEPVPTEPLWLAEPTVPPTQPIPPQPTEPEIPVFTNLNDFRVFLYRQMDAGVTELEFSYTGEAMDMTAQSIARIGSLFYVEAVHQQQSYQVSIWRYPGDRIVEAYRTGSRDQLSTDECMALDAAVNMVTQAKERASGELELEAVLFDMLRDRVTYNDESTQISDPAHPPRHLTAVGALVDGSANCQGYADGFYTLASIAGFQTGRMNVDIKNGGHIVNVIQIGGSWYVVDATFNDSDDPSGAQVSYRLLNAGLDKCLEYQWDPVMERYPIAQNSDGNYYYYAVDTAAPRLFLDLDEMAEDILRQWQSQGLTRRHLMLQGKVSQWNHLADALNTAANRQGLMVQYNIWAESNGQDTFFYVDILP